MTCIQWHAVFNSGVNYQWYWLQIHCYANILIPAMLILTLVSSSSFSIRHSVCHANNAVQLNFFRKPGHNYKEQLVLRTKLCRFTVVTGYFANVSVHQRTKSIHQHRFQVIKIKVLLIWKNFHRQSGIDVEEKILFRVESHVFAGKKFESKYKFPWLKILKPICFSEYLQQFLELWNTLKPFGNTLETPY